MTRQPSILDAINFEHALEFSYNDYHSQKLDYLCLFRSKLLTFKAYFFDEGSVDDLIVPHNHRYSFDTHVLAGQLDEVRYISNLRLEGLRSRLYSKYMYESPLDGGSGFWSKGNQWLTSESTRYYPGQGYHNRAHEDIHTLQNVLPGTILLVTQYQDVEPSGTFAWSTDSKRPSTEGLYNKMRPADVLRRIDQLESLLT